MTSWTEICSGGAGQGIPAAGAADALDQSRAPEPEEDLLDVVAGQALRLRDVPRRHRLLPRPAAPDAAR